MTAKGGPPKKQESAQRRPGSGPLCPLLVQGEDAQEFNASVMRDGLRAAQNSRQQKKGPNKQESARD